MERLLITGYGLYTLQSQLLWQGPTHICSQQLGGCTELLEAVRSSSEQLCPALLVAPPRDRDLIIFTRSCSELFGALSLQVASPTGTYRYLYLLATTRSCSEQKSLSNQSHSKCTNGTVYKVKTSKLGNIVKPGKYCKTWTTS